MFATDPVSGQKRGLVAINLAAVVFGTSALYGRLDLSPFWIVGGRALCAALILSLLAILRGRSIPSGSAFLRGVFLTGLLLGIHWVTFFMTVQKGSVAIATLTFAAFPVFTVCLDALWLRRRLSARAIGCALMILLAVAILYDPSAALARRQAVAIGLFSALLFALFGRLSQDLGRDHAPEWLSASQNAVVCLSLLPIAIFGGMEPPVGTDWGFILMLGIINTALMHQLYFVALRYLSASLASAFLALEPVYAMLFAAMLFGERVTPVLLCSAVLILAASIMLLRYEGRMAAQEPDI